MPAFYFLCFIGIGLLIISIAECYEDIGETIGSWWEDFIEIFKNKKEN